MKGFFKFTFASILGVIIGLFLFILIILGIFSAASREKPVVVDANTVLFTKFAEPIADREPKNPFEYLNPVTFEPESRMGLDMILENIHKAKEHENIPGIVLNISAVPAGMATLHEIRNALIDFKSEGKFIMCYANNLTQGSYYLATAADKIFMTPEGTMPFLGLSSEVVFLKGALDKLGIEMQVFKKGEYKGAVEPLLYKELSEENRQQIQDYLNSLWEEMVEEISEARSVPVSKLNELADNIEIFSAEDAFNNKLIDDLLFYDEFIAKIKELTNTDEEDDIKTISFDKLDKVPKKRKEKGLARDKVAVVYASGNIVGGSGVDGMIGGDAFAKAIRKARRDSSVKAIVLRVNSPGGSGQASDLIWREVKLAKEVKPVIVSMGDVAASGGYYISAAADKILANPNTITGSIGVFGVFPNMQELLNEKMGITSDVVKTNEHANFGSPFGPLDEPEIRELSEQVENFYTHFVEIVADGRGMTYEEVDKIARGHVYTGIRAMELGLVDEMGGLEEAIEVAVSEAGIENYRIVKLPKLEDPFEKILKELSGNTRTKILKEELGEQYYYYEKIKEAKSMKGIQARLPYDLKIQ